MIVDTLNETMTTAPNPPTNGIERAIHIAGNQSRLASSIGTSQQMVSHWKRVGIVSDAGMCAAIERATGVRCEELNPNEDWATLRLVLCAPERDNFAASDDVQPPAGGSVSNTKEMRMVAD